MKALKKLLQFFVVILLVNAVFSLPTSVEKNSDAIDIPLVVGDDLEFEVVMGPAKILEPTPASPAVIINHPIKARQSRKINRYERRDPPLDVIFVQPESGNQKTENFESGNFETTRNFESTGNFESGNDESGNDESGNPPLIESNEKFEEANRNQRNILPPSAQGNRARYPTSRPSNPSPSSSYNSQSESQSASSSYSSQPSKSSYSSKNEEEIPIIRNSKTVSQKEDKAYEFDFESGNGIQREEKGFLKNPTSKNPAQVMSGSWSYTGPDGKVYTITYVADENGFRAEGDHLPVSPSG